MLIFILALLFFSSAAIILSLIIIFDSIFILALLLFYWTAIILLLTINLIVVPASCFCWVFAHSNSFGKNLHPHFAFVVFSLRYLANSAAFFRILSIQLRRLIFCRVRIVCFSLQKQLRMKHTPTLISRSSPF